MKNIREKMTMNRIKIWCMDIEKADDGGRVFFPGGGGGGVLAV